MKKIFTLLAGVTMALSATAVENSDYAWVVTPAPETSVTELSNIVISYASTDYYDVTVEQSFVEVYKDDEPFSEVTITNDTDSDPRTINIALKTPATEPGVYTLAIMQRGVTFFLDDSYENYTENTETILFNYTIEDQGNTGNFSYTVTPASGTDVESLSTIRFDFTGCAEALIDIDHRSDITVTRDGNPYETTFSIENVGEEMYSTLTLNTPATETGTYVVTIPESAMGYFNDDYDFFPVSATLTYTIGGGGVSGFSYTVNPASGSELETLSTIRFDFTGCAEALIDIDHRSEITVTRDGNPYETTFSIENVGEEMYSTLTLNTPATEPGTYVVTIPESVMGYFNDDYDFFPVSATLTYTVVASAQPVVYDLMPISTKPADGAEIDLQNDPFNVLFLNVNTGVNAAADATVTIKNTDYPDSYDVTVPLKFSFDGRLWASFDEPSYNGTYTITVPKGSYGDADWQKNPETGHSNPELVITVTVTDGREISTVEYTLQPNSYTPDAITTPADLTNITLVFNEDVQLVSHTNNAILFFTNDFNGYYEGASFEATEQAGTFTVQFPEPTDMGDYTLEVLEKTFGDAEFYESDGVSGKTNPKLTINWSLAGVDAIDFENGEAIYFDLNGNRVSNPAKGQIIIKVQKNGNSKIRF